MGKKISIILIIIIIALLIIVFYRSSASAQVSSGNSVSQLFSHFEKNLNRYGVKISPEPSGKIENREHARRILLNGSEFFLILSGETAAKVRMSYVRKQNDELYSSISNSIIDSVQAGDDIYDVSYGGDITHLTISPDGQRQSGLFAAATRLPYPSWQDGYPMFFAKNLQSNCSKKY